MIAVLFNQADVRLGEVCMPDVCRLIVFGGATFVRTETEALLEEGGLGIAFEFHDRYVVEHLDKFNPTKTFGQVRRKRDAEAEGGKRPAVQGRPAAPGEVDDEGRPT